MFPDSGCKGTSEIVFKRHLPRRAFKEVLTEGCLFLGYPDTHTRRGGEGVALDVVDEEREAGEIVSSLDPTIGFISPMVDFRENLFKVGCIHDFLRLFTLHSDAAAGDR
jgi:hypothetical protein